MALLTAEMLEGARDGKSVEDVMSLGGQLLTTDDVMDGVAEMLKDLQLEATFRDGTKLVSIHNPIRGDRSQVVPGEYLLEQEEVELNVGKEVSSMTVANTADRPIQVGSHFHFFEANRGLRFPREQAYGKRLNIPSGTAVRFEPGEEKEVSLIPISGRRVVYGMNALVNGQLDNPTGGVFGGDTSEIVVQAEAGTRVLVLT